MKKLAKVSYENGNIGYFLSDDLNVKKNDYVIVETERGLQVGQVLLNISEYKEKDIIDNPYKIVRFMNKSDFRQHDRNRKDAMEALVKGRKIVKEMDLDMNFIDSFYTFDRNQLVFNFMADNRIDFRELAKKLAQLYHTRIELHQVGVRDKAKQIGGIGPCGRFLCCSTFLTDFDSVSINMAKNQYIALNPTKINGVCGRLLCCLKYEDEQYKEMKKGLPKVGQTVSYAGVKGKVSSINLLTKKMILEQGNKNFIEVDLEDSDGSIK